MRLRAGLRVLRRGGDELQVGTDPRWAVRLAGLAPGEAGRLLSHGSVPDEHALAADLALAGLAVPDDAPEGRAPDDAAWGLLRSDDDPAARARRRAAACVGVVGLGPAGVGIATGLAAAGVGTVLLDDERPVGPADVGATGYRWSDVGLPREQAAVRAMRDAAPGVAVDGAAPHVIVAVEGGAADPARGERLVNLDVTHLSVVVREADTVVGPLVVPGAGPCLRCLDLHRTDLDPAWPVLLSQLAGSEVPEPGPVATVAAGLAVAAVLAVVDGLPPVVGRSWEVGLPDAVPRERTWVPHPRCGCAGLPDEP